MEPVFTKGLTGKGEGTNRNGTREGNRSFYNKIVL